jgi:2-dehydro-3-deoxy-L-rhamnonate dehydrogenase (NAD+)
MTWDVGNFQSRIDQDGSFAVLIVGGGSGIGAATAHFLARCGAKLAIADTLLSAASNVAEAIAQEGGSAVAVEMNVAQEKSVKSAVAELHGHLGQAFHAVINTAGITGATNVGPVEVELGDFDRVCAINLRGALVLTQAILPGMLQRGFGRILHIASIAGKEGNAGMAAYSASKAGLIGLVKSIAKDLATTGVTINALAPAVIRTPLVDALPQTTVNYMTSKIPMARCGELEEAARMAAWIVSPACSFTSGFAFDLSGGRATY